MAEIQGGGIIDVIPAKGIDAAEPLSNRMWYTGEPEGWKREGCPSLYLPEAI